MFTFSIFIVDIVDKWSNPLVAEHLDVNKSRFVLLTTLLTTLLQKGTRK